MTDLANAFTMNYPQRVSALITDVIIGEPFDPGKGQGPSIGGSYRAIWDTGATKSVITQRVVEHGKLQPIGMVNVHTVSGTNQSPVYLVAIGLPNNVWFFDTRVSVGVLTPDIDVLIGMDVISRGDLAITCKDGKTTFSFQCPSSNHIDFVKSIEGATRKPGRNQLCPCGSGKKYKHCHGKVT